jgi:ATP-dependent protease ClpP protease subunit
MFNDLNARFLQVNAAKPSTPPVLFNAKSATEGDFYVYDYIGEIYGGVSAKQVVDALKNAAGVKKLTMYVNSPGGDYFECKAMFSELTRFAQSHELVAIVDGQAASAASLIVQAAARRVMSPGSTMMIHEIRTHAGGRAQDLRDVADLVEMENQNLINLYSARTGLDAKEIGKMLASGDYYMTAEQAVELGFADEVAGQKVMAKASATATRFAALAERTKTILSDADVRRAVADMRLRRAQRR